MTIRRMLRPARKITLTVDEENYEKLKGFYPVVGAAEIIRRLIDNHVAALDAKMPKMEDLHV